MTLTQNYPQLKKVPQWLTTLLVILLGISLAKLLWMFLTPIESVAIQTPVNANRTISKPKKQQNYGKIIADQHLFGKVERKIAPPPQPQQIKAPPPVVSIPALNVKLHGIMSYNKKSTGYALLSYNGKAQQVYAVNDALDDDKKIIVISISKEKVVISNHGKAEEFVLPRDTLAKNDTSTPSPNNSSFGNRSISPPPGVNSTALSPTKPFMPQAGIQKNKSGNTPSIKNMAKFREQVMADPSKLMEVANAAPYSKDGVFIGFRVSPGKQRRFFRQLGLRNGDVIKEVNGIQLDSPEKGLMLMSELSGASDLNITVLRGTRDVQLPTLHF